MKKMFILLIVSIVCNSFAQEKTDIESMKKQSKIHTYQANERFENQKNIAESHYRKAIAKDNENSVAPYNMGGLLYKQNFHKEAEYFFKEASVKKDASKDEKHKAFHNMGNVFMQTKAYDKAVMAYKEALRHNPDDDQTRYNLAVAKEFLKNNPPQDKENKKDEQQNKENENNSDNKDKQQNNSDNQQDKNQDTDPKHQNTPKDQQNQQNTEDKNNEDKPKNSPQKGQLSPEQIERILEAMHNEERKTQEKINAQKMKGKPIRSEKDW